VRGGGDEKDMKKERKEKKALMKLFREDTHELDLQSNTIASINKAYDEHEFGTGDTLALDVLDRINAAKDE